MAMKKWKVILQILTINTVHNLTMKYIFCAILLFCFTQIFAISPPVYKRMEGWKFEKIANGELSITNNIVMFNPNKIGCVKLKEIYFDVYIEDAKLGTITQATDKVVIKKKAEFIIPLRYTIRPQGSLFDNFKSLYGFLTKKIKITYDGRVKIVALLIFPYKANVKDYYEVGLKDIL